MELAIIPDVVIGHIVHSFDIFFITFYVYKHKDFDFTVFTGFWFGYYPRMVDEMKDPKP